MDVKNYATTVAYGPARKPHNIVLFAIFFRIGKVRLFICLCQCINNFFHNKLHFFTGDHKFPKGED